MQTQRLQRLRLVNSAIGFVLCGFAASLLAILFWNSRYQIVAPILFTVVVVAVAMRFGRVVGILGTLFGAALFAIWLYPPIWKLAREQPAGSRRPACVAAGRVSAVVPAGRGVGGVQVSKFHKFQGFVVVAIRETLKP
jgi:hypothetical protein